MNNLQTSVEATSTKSNELKPKIYCDMDGVLVDFDKQFTDSISPWNPKKFIEKNGLDEFWKEIDERGVGFWVGMNWMEDGKELFEFITSNFEVELLSSPSRSETSRLGKRLWVRNHKLGVKLNLAYSHNKQKYAAPNHILIDDRKDLIEEWESQGGIGILHTSTKNTIECLRKKVIL
jgi:phosphoglycolate phosphatase-like HAD superfamily hydrolase